MGIKITDTVNVRNVFKRANFNQNLVFLRMASSLSENIKLTFALKMRLFLYYQDSRDNKPITGTNTQTICDL
jgi:hypothetical protein